MDGERGEGEGKGGDNSKASINCNTTVIKGILNLTNW